MQLTDSCNVATLAHLLVFPGTAGVDALFVVVVKTTDVGSVSSGQPFCFTVAHTKTQSISSHWKHKTYGVNIHSNNSHEITSYNVSQFYMTHGFFFLSQNPVEWTFVLAL